jgi:hypothetical protein
MNCPLQRSGLSSRRLDPLVMSAIHPESNVSGTIKIPLEPARTSNTK